MRSLIPAHSNPAASIDLDQLLPPHQPHIRLTQLAHKLGLSPDYITKLTDCGILYGHAHHSNKEALRKRNRSSSKHRYTRTITRESVLAYLIETADYDEQMRLDRMCELLRRYFSPEQLQLLSDYAEKLAQRNRNINPRELRV